MVDSGPNCVRIVYMCQSKYKNSCSVFAMTRPYLAGGWVVTGGTPLVDIIPRDSSLSCDWSSVPAYN